MSFSQSIKRFSKVAEVRGMNVVRTACILLVEDAQRLRTEGGRMPFKTGALRDSLVCSAGGTTFSGLFSYLPAVAALKPGDVFTFGWTVHYAIHQEYGTRNHPACFFARGAIQQWPRFVRVAAGMYSVD